MQTRGLTLMEVMIVVVILGIMAAAVVLPQIQTVEAGKRRAARDVLEAIYAGEQVYKTFNKRFCTPNPSALPPPALPPPADCTWSDINVDDPTTLTQGVAFSVDVRGAASDFFTATATRTAGACLNRTLTIDDARLEATDWPRNGQC